MKSNAKVSTSEKLDYLLHGLEYEMCKSFNVGKSCIFFIAILDTATHSEIYANERKVFTGTDAECKKVFKEVINKIKKYNKENNDIIALKGDLKEIVYIRKRI